MKARYWLAKAVFFMLLFFQTYLISRFDQDASSPNLEKLYNATSATILHQRISLFILAVLIAFIMFFLSLEKMKDENKDNKKIITVLLLYIAYQFLVALPLAYLYRLGSIRDLIIAALSHVTLVLIPFFLWFVFPAFKGERKPINWITISSVILLAAAAYNYFSGSVFITNTGQMRLLSGGSALIFSMAFLTGVFSRKYNTLNVSIALVGLLGLLSINFRSAYIFMAIVVIIGLFISGASKVKLKRFLVITGLGLGVLLLMSQSAVFKDNVIGRINSIKWQDGNVQGRVEDYGLAWQKFLDNPINGSLKSDIYYRPIYYDHFPPHNFILEIMATQGIIGLFFYVYILFESLRIAYRNRLDNRSLQMFLVLVFYVLLSSFNVCFLSQWSMLILVIVISVILKRNQELEELKSAKTE